MRLPLLLALLLAASSVRGATPARAGLYLYDLSKLDSERDEPPLEPRRVYVKYEPEWKRWVLVMSDERAQIASPTRALLPGSVVSGVHLGGESDRRYKLTASGTWAVTSEPESYWFWVNGDPPSLSHERFSETGKAGR